MPRPHKRNILGETWEYTLLADAFSEIDKDAENLNPPAGTMSWSGYSYPDVAYKFDPSQGNNGINYDKLFIRKTAVCGRINHGVFPSLHIFSVIFPEPCSAKDLQIRW